MSALRSRLALLFLPAFTLALLAGCDEQPVPPSSDMDVPEAMFSHGPDGAVTATARYLPINGSGVQGVVAILDDGSTTWVSALATGLEPPADNPAGYSSLLYDRASQLQGPLACEPGKNVGTGTDHPLSLTFPQMIIGNFGTGEWAVNADGFGSLGPFQTAEYVSVDRVCTISIRDLSVIGFLGPGTGPEAVVACGKVTTQ